MGKVFEFEAIILKVPDIDGAYIEFPFDVRKEFGKGRVKVKATFDGVEYFGSLVRMQPSDHSIGVRKAIGKEPGDKIKVRIEEI